MTSGRRESDNTARPPPRNWDGPAPPDNMDAWERNGTNISMHGSAVAESTKAKESWRPQKSSHSNVPSCRSCPLDTSLAFHLPLGPPLTPRKSDGMYRDEALCLAAAAAAFPARCCCSETEEDAMRCWKTRRAAGRAGGSRIRSAIVPATLPEPERWSLRRPLEHPARTRRTPLAAGIRMVNAAAADKDDAYEQLSAARGAHLISCVLPAHCCCGGQPLSPIQSPIRKKLPAAEYWAVSSFDDSAATHRPSGRDVVIGHFLPKKTRRFRKKNIGFPGRNIRWLANPISGRFCAAWTHRPRKKIGPEVRSVDGQRPPRAPAAVRGDRWVWWRSVNANPTGCSRWPALPGGRTASIWAPTKSRQHRRVMPTDRFRPSGTRRMGWGARPRQKSLTSKGTTISCSAFRTLASPASIRPSTSPPMSRDLLSKVYGPHVYVHVAPHRLLLALTTTVYGVILVY